jgi:hypothetical protein
LLGSFTPPDGFTVCTKVDGKSKLPSLVKEGCREAAGGSFNKINLLISTTPALRATPPQLRRGVFADAKTFSAKPGFTHRLLELEAITIPRLAAVTMRSPACTSLDEQDGAGRKDGDPIADGSEVC